MFGCIFMVVLVGLPVLGAGESGGVDKDPAWLAPSIGPFSPSVHVNAAISESSGKSEELQLGYHDPTREQGTIQSIEVGLSLRYEMLEGFATYNFGYGADEEWSDELEEAFLKLCDLPGGFELRGGRKCASTNKTG